MSSTLSTLSEEIDLESRPVELTVWVLGTTIDKESHTIWLHPKSTYGYVKKQLTFWDETRSFTVLRGIYGPRPHWTESDPGSLVGNTCRNLYAVAENGNTRYILGVIRTSKSDYPIPIYDLTHRPGFTVSKEIVTAHPNLAGMIRSITRYNADPFVEDPLYEDEVAQRRKQPPGAWTVYLIKLSEPSSKFLDDLWEKSIPPLLRIPYAYSKHLLRRAYGLDTFAMQTIHISSAILHIICCLATELTPTVHMNITEMTSLYSTDDFLAKTLAVTPQLAQRLQSILEAIEIFMNRLEIGGIGQKEARLEMEDFFIALCGDYPGAITVRHSSLRFKKMVGIDEDNMRSGVTPPPLTPPRPISPSNVNKTGILSSLVRKLKQRFSLVDEKDGEAEVWLLDNIAYPVFFGTSQWKAEYVVAFFKGDEDTRTRLSSTITAIFKSLEIAPGDEVVEKRIEERIAPFLRQIGPFMTADVHYQENPGDMLHLGPSEENGIFSKDLDVPTPGGSLGFSPGSSKIMTVAHKRTESSDQNSATAKLEMGRTFFAADLPTSIGVISGVDDTIKIAEVHDRLKLLKHTFIGLPTEVPIMAVFYNKLHEAITASASPSPFVYLSASPYQLYPLLNDFIRDAGFPDGMLILRDASWMGMESFVLSLTMGTQEYKEDRMKKVARWLPCTKWVCIGDSTQTDPEAYAAFYKYQLSNTKGGRVARIWIRKVVGVNPSVEKHLNSPERFEKAFKGIPKSVFRVFEHPEELFTELEALKIARILGLMQEV